MRQKKPNRRAAVDRGCVLELDRDAAHERPQDDDRDRDPECRLREGDAEQRLVEAELAQQQVERQSRDRDGEEQPEREERVDRLAAAELEAATADMRRAS